ncbi:hypothetical protein ACJRO7_016064 [Eucalyptus globulus]|uniref:TIR domain-containing protein n=1 Tax=Eucalyptus globulus TaxID=34317 RepID=A0ABD3L9F7_EUCGL
MANLEIGMSTSNTLGGEYQVFLSFRGPDTRHSFTDILCQTLVDAGIRVFIDDKGLRHGERISDNLLQAIDNSKLYIPIFSKNYASSHWCLDDLAKMVENTSKHKEDEKEKVILPIFYHVKLDDVKLKTELYKDAISNLEQKMEDQKPKFSSKDIETWRQALKEVGHIKGWEVENDSSHAKLIQAVVHEVMARLKIRQRSVTRDEVGMKDRIAHIKESLDIDAGGVVLIGIHGMGGIGKTTLAKKIFNQLCPQYGRNCIFLDDVRETEKTKGLVELQKKLLSNISNSHVANQIDDIEVGINMIEDTICNKKMLIVLDDVDKADQIQKLIGEKCLYPGTRILVTTRDKNVLKIRNCHHKIAHYKMMELSGEDALQLFSRYAFNVDSPPADYYALLVAIVRTTNGLPLALETIASALFQEEREIWEEWLEKLKETSHEDVLAKLRISYDALKQEEQEIFLDITCFLVGENKTNPIYMWKDCKFYPGTAIKALIDRCMIKEGKVKKRVQALRLASPWDRDEPITITSEQIKRFPLMRFLSLHGVICQGDFTDYLYELKWINLKYTYVVPAEHGHRRQWFEATNSLHLENVVVVTLSGLDITEDVFESLITGARKLKVLTISYNTLIRRIPTFPWISVLEKLTISDFLSLVEIDCSIGQLVELTDLSFKSCVELEKLPEQIGKLQKLQHLSLSSCDSLRELPNSVLQLKSLTKLDVLGTRITGLPDSIGRLSRLSSVNVSFTTIEKLPSTMSELLHLQTLHLHNCDRIQELSKLPGSLTTLQLTSSSLVTVPDLSYLTNLVELALSDGSESKARSDIIQAHDLRWIGNLSKLSKLQLCFSNVRAPTTELGSLSLLQELTLHGVDVPTFEQLPSELMVLELYDTRGKQILLPPSEKETAIVSSSSSESEENKASRQVRFKGFEACGSSERDLSIVSSCLNELEENKAKRHKALRQVEFRFLEAYGSSVCPLEEPGCNELQAPELIDHWRGAFDFPISLNMLQKFVLWGCPGVQDFQFVSVLESLLVFSVGGCTSLKRLGGLSNLKNLMELTLNRCWSLQVVEGVDELAFLHQLKIDRCGSVERILDPSSSKIPDRCSILITRSGELPDCDNTYDIWESYRVRFFHEERVRLLPIHRSSLFLLLYLLSISALF